MALTYNYRRIIEMNKKDLQELASTLELATNQINALLQDYDGPTPLCWSPKDFEGIVDAANKKKQSKEFG